LHHQHAPFTKQGLNTFPLTGTKIGILIIQCSMQ
jgi:hypothetical protein